MTRRCTSCRRGFKYTVQTYEEQTRPEEADWPKDKTPIATGGKARWRWADTQQPHLPFRTWANKPNSTHSPDLALPFGAMLLSRLRRCGALPQAEHSTRTPVRGQPGNRSGGLSGFCKSAILRAKPAVSDSQQKSYSMQPSSLPPQRSYPTVLLSERMRAKNVCLCICLPHRLMAPGRNRSATQNSYSASKA